MNNALIEINNQLTDLLDRYGHPALDDLLRDLSHHVGFGKNLRNLYLCVNEEGVLFLCQRGVALISLDFNQGNENQQPELQQEEQGQLDRLEQEQQLLEQQVIPHEWTSTVNKYRNTHERLIENRINRLLNPSRDSIFVFQEYLSKVFTLDDLVTKMSSLFVYVTGKEKDMIFYRRLLCWYFYLINKILLDRGLNVEQACDFLIRNQFMESTSDYSDRLLIGKKAQTILSVVGPVGLLSTELILETRFKSSEDKLPVFHLLQVRQWKQVPKRKEYQQSGG
ncbi:hypothetical protein BD770DRAFT_394872 [Pilaira anomala]|nr:hypothetical protein BD770DRAFT_394872 [Pilaira anomala]